MPVTHVRWRVNDLLLIEAISFCARSHDFIGEFSTSYREMSRSQSQFHIYEVPWTSLCFCLFFLFVFVFTFSTSWKVIQLVVN